MVLRGGVVNMAKKRIQVMADYLGAIKQLPPFIRELRTALPEAIIDIETNDYVNLDRETNTSRTLREDLAFEELADSGVLIDCPDGGNADASVSFVCAPNSVVFGKRGNIGFHIDPLKFEPRRLLDAEEIAKLRDKYFLGDRKVVLGGSIHGVEMEDFVAQANKVIRQNPDIKIMTVLRNPTDKVKLDNLGVNYAMNGAPSGKDLNYTLVTEMGVLDRLYSICDVAVMGDTLLQGWGQNPLEPAFYGKRIVSGKSFTNNGVAYRGLQNSGLLKMVNGEGLADEVLREVPEGELADSQRRAARFIESKQGAAKFYAGLVAEIVNGGDNLSTRERASIGGRLFHYSKHGSLVGVSC